jgi:transposase-like protein
MRVRTCPVCNSERVIIILRDERRGLCYDCGSQWVESIVGEREIVSVSEYFSGAQRRGPRSQR